MVATRCLGSLDHLIETVSLSSLTSPRVVWSLASFRLPLFDLGSGESGTSAELIGEGFHVLV